MQGASGSGSAARAQGPSASQVPAHRRQTRCRAPAPRGRCTHRAGKRPSPPRAATGASPRTRRADTPPPSAAAGSPAVRSPPAPAAADPPDRAPRRRLRGCRRTSVRITPQALPPSPRTYGERARRGRFSSAGRDTKAPPPAHPSEAADPPSRRPPRRFRPSRASRSAP